jgi:Ras GTPase-activating-like protein IQGAP2/3
MLLTRCFSTPETFDIVNHTIDIGARKNLAQISRVLTQITSISEFGEDNPNYIPINDYVRTAISEMTHWLLEGTLVLVRQRALCS